MPRPKQSPIAIQPAQGKKKTFDVEESDQEEDYPVAGPSSGTAFSVGVENNDDDDEDDEGDWSDEDDDDDAPEAVSVGAAKKGLVSREEAVASVQSSKKEAAAARSKAIADAKAAARLNEKAKKGINKPNPAGTKRKLVSVDAEEAAPAKSKKKGEDAEAERLRKRMEAAMAAGDEESDEDEEDGDGVEFHTDSEDEDGDEDEGEESFHTDSEDEEGDEEEGEDGDSDSSETLKEDGPISSKERQMRAQMQAMMEAMEARSGVSAPKKATKADNESKGKGVKSAMKGGKRPIEAVEEPEEDNFDLAPLSGFGKPLSAKLLKAAAREDEMEKERQAEKERIEKERAREAKRDKRKKRKVEEKETVRTLSNGKHLQILDQDLPVPGTGLPPIMSARSAKPAGAQSRTSFFGKAMKSSGTMPGKGLVDGRKRIIASRT